MKDRKTRDRALASLRTYLHRAATFTPLEFLKLWKGLFYCMWMQDKPRNQQRLARDLAELVDVLGTKQNVLGFLDGFWKTMGREWGNIDALRMDKYLYLVRCYVNKGFEKVAKGGWEDEELMEGYLKLLEATPFDARDHKIPNGLRYHIIDIYVDELDKVDTERNAPLETLLQPLRKLGKESPTKAVRLRVKEASQDGRLSDWTGENADKESSGDEEQVAGSDDGEFGGFGD